jgi:hypothetical protein
MAPSFPVPAGAASRGLWIVRALALWILSACGAQEDWSPLDGPWDPDHPDAAAILETPEPDAPIDLELAEAGERWYRVRGCLACHRLDGQVAVGPPLDGITLRREYPWYRAMVMRPDSMLRHDPVARELLRVYRVPMPDQGVDELRTRAMWEYHRRLDRAPGDLPGG